MNAQAALVGENPEMRRLSICLFLIAPRHGSITKYTAVLSDGFAMLGSVSCPPGDS